MHRYFANQDTLYDIGSYLCKNTVDFSIQDAIGPSLCINTVQVKIKDEII